MKKRAFVDLDKSGYTELQDATGKRQHLNLVQSTVAGGDDEAQAQVERLTIDFVDVLDAINLLLTERMMPPRFRGFVDAVAGVTAGSDEFVEITDKVLSKRLGKSVKTVQRLRDEFRKWKHYRTVVDIKDNWRDRETFESHAHAYRCNITRYGVEAAIEARLYGDYESDPKKALAQAAEVVAKSLPGFKYKKPKKRAAPSDAQKVLSELRFAATKLEQAVKLAGMASKQMDYEQLYAERERIEAALAAFDAGFNIERRDVMSTTPLSMQNKEEETMDKSAPSSPDVAPVETRMDTPLEPDFEAEVDTVGSGGQTVHHPPLKATDSTVCGSPAVSEPHVEAEDDSPLDVVLLGPAVWKNADNDVPVVITGNLGRAPDGRQYVSIKGSAAGVPLDEIQYLPRRGLPNEVVFRPGDDVDQVYEEYQTGVRQ